MHIGNFVQKKGSKGSLGFISERPPIAYCWNVVWVRGDRKGSSSIVREEDLVLAGRKK